MCENSKPQSAEEFIEILAPIAADICGRYGLRASVCIAQAAIETGWGKNAIGLNWFGRKAVEGDAQEVKTTREFINGEWITIDAGFKSYNSLPEAVEDYCALLTQEPVYVNALAAADGTFEGYVEAVADVYATDPSYTHLIKAVIREWELRQFDGEAA